MDHKATDSMQGPKLYNINDLNLDFSDISTNKDRYAGRGWGERQDQYKPQPASSKQEYQIPNLASSYHQNTQGDKLTIYLKFI